jgi:hypothetical protein
MSSSLCGLLSATFHEPGYDHIVEVVHQRDADARRHLASLDLALYDAAGKLLAERPVDPRLETLDLGALVESLAGAEPRVMVALDARYSPEVFPYRPHHYGYLHKVGASTPPLYYAVNAVLGGVPDRIDNARINNFETYVFSRHAAGEACSVILGNLARFAPAEAQVFGYYEGGARATHAVALPPRAHTEVSLAGEQAGQRLCRLEIKTLFRLATYVVGRRVPSGERVLFDHLFTYLT